MPNVFLSYSRSDARIVDKIAADLQHEGIDVWLDRKDLVAGKSWQSQIVNAILEAEAVIVFISRSSLESKAVQSEYQIGFVQQGKSGGNRLIPVLLEKVELPKFLSRIQYVDFTESYDQGIKDLIRALSVSVGPKPKDIIPVSDLAKEVAGEVAKILGLESKALHEKISKIIDPKLVFVIIAFRDDMEPIFEGIKTAGSSVGLRVERVKDVPGDYRITDQVVKMINTAKFIVADLTHERPNVYFELGYARGLDKTVITVARDGTNIHFDVKDWTYISYTDSRILERDIKKRFEYELSKR
ncbi:MAG: TIR domain-containing protein [Anaerolineae bacterium]|nr:TIR domain-containing protein [Anaerolineae bacterium]